MHVLSRIVRVLVWGGIIMMISAIVVLSAHVFLGDRRLDTGHNFFPPASRFLEPDARRFSVVLLSDTATNDIVLERIMDDVNTSGISPAFFLYLGDFVKDSWADFYWMLHEIKDELNDRPMYFTPGNHDVTRRRQIDKSFYRHVLGQEYYWFGYGDVLFIGLDTSAESLDGEQLHWLDATLRNVGHDFNHTIIFSHVPPAAAVAPNGESADHALSTDSATALKNVLKKHRVDAMFFGHVHYWSANKFAGVPFYTTPPAGQGARATNERYGYVVVNIGPRGIEKVEPRYIDYTGDIREHGEAWIINNVINYKTCRAIRVIIPMCIILFGLAGVLGLLKRLMKRNRL